MCYIKPVLFLLNTSLHVAFQMTTYNWIVTCKCDKPVEYCCNTCGEKLCSNCKKRHLQSIDFRHHSVVEYTHRLSQSCMSSSLCPDHEGRECIYWCQQCQKVACIECVISSHHGHMFTKLETKLLEKKCTMQNQLDYLESNPLKDWESLLSQAKLMTADFLDNINNVERNMESRAKYFHDQINEILKHNKKELKELPVT